ncbi:MAG TPA: N(G),N(G)-dimethylarginine dimethylaminohydrolase, partial [Sphingomicrobium sp.]|nr:N(G),N(G)-dimethylarginine dimethylaminohydrolase [Sphingomicrobium sp.]
MSRAFTRQVSPRIVDCALTHLDRRPIDPGRAAAQHSTYEQALRDAGYEVIRLPDLADDPDAVFVEDTAILLGEHAVITRPGAAS